MDEYVVIDGAGAMRCSRSTSRRPRSGSGRRSPTPSSGQVQLRRRDALGLDAGLTLRVATAPGVMDIAEGENLEVDPPRRLVQSFTALWSDEVEAEGSSRVTWEIEPVGNSCRLRVTHDELAEDANSELCGGWPMILSGLKTLLETGELLDTPGSLRYAGG